MTAEDRYANEPADLTSADLLYDRRWALDLLTRRAGAFAKTTSPPASPSATNCSPSSSRANSRLPAKRNSENGSASPKTR